MTNQGPALSQSIVHHACLIALAWLANEACTTSVQTGGALNPAGAHAPARQANPASQTAPSEAPETYAITLSEGTLYRDDGASRVALGAVDGAEQCYSDASHKVVWTVGPKGVATFDMVDGKHHKVVETNTDIDKFVVQIFEDPTDPYPSVVAGNVDEMDDCVALVIAIGADPKVGGGVVGTGDRLVYCYANEDTEELESEYAAVVKRYDSIPSFDIGYLKELEARRRMRTPGPGKAAEDTPPPPKVDVPQSACIAEPDDCGQASYIGGRRFWSVITANDRGDFYHEDSQLYDAISSEFFDPATGRRSTKPIDPVPQLDQLEVSKDGAWAVYDGKRLSLTKGEMQGELAGAFCGWGPL